jgi:hypothetical protein
MTTRSALTLALVAPALLLAACDVPPPETAGDTDEVASALVIPDVSMLPELAVEPPVPAAADCNAIRQRLTEAEAQVSSLQEMLAETPPGPERKQVLIALGQARAKVNRLQAELARCLNPPPPRPDLAVARIELSRPAGATRATATLVLANRGAGPVSGPFKAVLGVSVPGVFRELPLMVPATVTIAPGAEQVAGSMFDIAVVRDANGVATFVLDALVDADQQVTEQSESNNTFHQVIRDHRN